MREIVLDTETTGLDPINGDRLVEIGCVEMVNRITTGNVYHVYINPERDMPAEAFKVHGLSAEFLSDKPKFAEVADSFLEFIADDTLVIHNAAFDIGFLMRSWSGRGGPSSAASGWWTRWRWPPQASGRTQQPRRAHEPLRDRFLPSREAWRAAGFRAAGRGL